MIRVLRLVLLSLAIATVSARTLSASPPAPPRPYLFGMNPPSGRDLWMGAWCNKYIYEAMRFAGGNNARIGASWHAIEAKRGTYQWDELDEEAALAQRTGIEPYCLIANTPPWALAKGKQPHAWGPEPQYFDDWARFCETLARRYRGRISHFELYNEENGVCWNEPNRPDEYAPMLKVAYPALKRGNPDCVMAIGGLDGAGWKRYYEYVVKLYDMGCGPYFDAVAVHPYNWRGPIDVDGIRNLRKVLDHYGDTQKPLWLTEYGWDNEHPIQARVLWLKESLDILSDPEFAYITQSSFHTLIDFDEHGFGLMAPPMRTKPTYHVFYNYRHGLLPLVVAAARTYEPNDKTRLPLRNTDFDSMGHWTTFGNTDGIHKHGAAEPVRPAGTCFGAVGDKALKNGGCYQRVPATKGQLVRAAALFLTESHGGDRKSAQCRIGIDPRGGTDPTAEQVRWCRYEITGGAWERFAVGQIKPLEIEADHVTVFLEHKQTAAPTGQVTWFDDVQLWSYPRSWIAIPTTSPAGDDMLARLLPPPGAPLAIGPYAAFPLAFEADLQKQSAPRDWDVQAGKWGLVPQVGYALTAGGPGRVACNKPLPDGDFSIEVDVYAHRALYVGLWMDVSPHRRLTLAATNWASRDNVGFFDTDHDWIACPYDAIAIASRGDAPAQSRFLPPPNAYRLRITRNANIAEAFLDEQPIGRIELHGDKPTRFGLYQPRHDFGGFQRAAVYRLPTTPKHRPRDVPKQQQQNNAPPHTDSR